MTRVSKFAALEKEIKIRFTDGTKAVFVNTKQKRVSNKNFIVPIHSTFILSPSPHKVSLIKAWPPLISNPCNKLVTCIDVLM